MAMYYNGKKVRNLYYNGKCITRLALGKEMTRLVEGDDFERAEWLKTGSGYPYIQVANEYNTDNNAYVETTFKGASVNGESDIAIGLGSDNSFGYRIFNYNNQIYIDIHKQTNGILKSKRLLFPVSPYQICHISINPYSYEVNGVSATYELGNGFDNLNSKYSRIYANLNNNDVHYAETKLRVNNAEHDFIPCRLLRPIPAALDANGIARSAGECGMYDSVSGKFYGNVANSGTFAVSDN